LPKLKIEDTILLLDTSRSMLRKDFKPNRLAIELQAAKSFIQTKLSIDMKDRISIITIGETPKKLIDFAFEEEKLKKQLRILELKRKIKKLNNDLLINGVNNWDTAYIQITKLIKSGIGFTAVFSASDIIAFGVKQAIEDNKLNIPDDISLVGYDDIPFASAISLTTVSQPTYEMGQNAMILLLNLIKGKIKTPQFVLLQPRLVIRNTCKKI